MIPSGSLELDLPAWAQGQLLPAAGSRASSSLLLAFPPAHTSSIGPLINPPRLSNLEWFLFPAGTISAGRPPTPTSIPPSLFLLRPFSFRAGGRVGSPISLSSALWLALSLGGQEQNIPSFGAARVLAAFQSGLPIPQPLSRSTPASSPHSSLWSSYAFFLIEDQFHFPV